MTIDQNAGSIERREYQHDKFFTILPYHQSFYTKKYNESRSHQRYKEYYIGY